MNAGDMTLADLEDLCEEVARLAEQAGRAIEEIAAAGSAAHTKGDGSPVTEADLAADRIIHDGLTALDRAFPVVSEEGEQAGVAQDPPGTFWLVDPLDGTKEFLARRPEYTVNIALVHEGRPILGVVVIPAAAVVYAAVAGGRPWTERPGAPRRFIRASGAERPHRAMVSRSHLSDRTREFLDRLGVVETVPSGSSRKVCAVAEGRADVYPRLGPTWLWDTAAAVAVARAAGCVVCDLQGRELRYDLHGDWKHQGFLVCSSAACRDRCLAALS